MLKINNGSVCSQVTFEVGVDIFGKRVENFIYIGDRVLIVAWYLINLF